MEVQKAKIVDLNADYAVVLTDSGAFKRIVRKDGMSVGGGIYITEHDLYLKTRASGTFKLPLFSKRLLQVTGVMVLLIMILVTQSFAPMSYAVISVDINPSIQLFIDEDYNVLRIESLNADGENLLSEYDFIKKKSASSVLTELFTLATEMDYLKADQNEILVAAALYKPSKNDVSKLKMGSDVDILLDKVLSEVDYSGFDEEHVVISSVTSNAQSIKAAEKEHLTIGQYEKERHSETVKPYAIVEDGKHIKSNSKPNENGNKPDTSTTGEMENTDKTNDNNNMNNGMDKDKDKDKHQEESTQETNPNYNNGNTNNNGNTSNNSNNSYNGKNHNNSNKNTNNMIDNIKHNVENSNFAGHKNKKNFEVEKVDEFKDSDEAESEKDGSKPKMNN